jgi:hypothetical protein
MSHSSRRTLTQPFDWQKLMVLVILGLITAIGTWYLSARASNTITISVPAHDLPMYHLITTSDLTTTVISTTELSSTVLRSDTDLLDHYTRKPLLGGKAVIATQLIPSTDPMLTNDTVVVSIPAAAAMTLNGQLTAGDIILIWEVSDVSATSPASLIVDRVLVLDVLPVPLVITNATETLPYVVVLAIPVNLQADILSLAKKGLLAFTLHP